MSRYRAFAFLGAVATLSVLAIGCSQGAARIHPPKVDPDKAGALAIELFDTNKDGKISGAELDKCPGLKSAITRVDTSGASEANVNNIAARIKAWHESKLGRASYNLLVLRNGAPFKDAEVRLVPEPFLGENMVVATGKVRPDGFVSPSVPTSGREDPPGVAPGFYRIEITKDGEKVSAKYNTETIYGLEVANDSPEGLHTMRIDVR